MDAINPILEAAWFQAILAVGGLWATGDAIWRITRWIATKVGIWRQRTAPQRATARVWNLCDELATTRRHIENPSVFIASVVGDILWMIALLLLVRGLSSALFGASQTWQLLILGIMLGTFAHFLLDLWQLLRRLRKVRNFPQAFLRDMARLGEIATIMECPKEFKSTRDECARYLLKAENIAPESEAIWSTILNLLKALAKGRVGDAWAYRQQLHDLERAA